MKKETFTATMLAIEDRNERYSQHIKDLLENPAIYHTYTGFRIDVIELLNQLTEKQKLDLLNILSSQEKAH